MYAIEATNLKKWHWIAGIFEQHSAANAFLLSIPEEACSEQQIVELPLNNYPVFVVEGQRFEYGDVNSIRAKLKSLSPHGNEDYLHMNVYAVRENFVPAEPGIDNMGSLLHWHITDSILRLPRSQVFDELLVKIANDR